MLNTQQSRASLPTRLGASVGKDSGWWIMGPKLMPWCPLVTMTERVDSCDTVDLGLTLFYSGCVEIFV